MSSEMQARLTLHTLPAQMAAMLIALVAALAIGGSIGYALKQPGVITHTITKTVGLPASDTSRSSGGNIWIGKTLYTQDGPGEPWHKQP